MKYYAGLDVSLKETFVSIIDEQGHLVKEGSVASESEALYSYLKCDGFEYERIGIESGQLSIVLCKGLTKKGLPVLCVDARHMAAALSARINKNDRNDARGIAKMLRAELYREVQIKSDTACEEKVLLGSRRKLVRSRQQLMGTIRGLLKIYGVKLGAKAQFTTKVREALQGVSEGVRKSLEALLSIVEAMEKSLKSLDDQLMEIVKGDAVCKRLMTVPGVGPIIAMTYKSTVDEPKRFKRSSTVGAYMGLTPRQYASGEVDRHGRVSKMGPEECRVMLYEAAQGMLTRVQKASKLRSWGLKLVKKKGLKKAVVAVARKMAVILHRMWVSEKEFCAQ